MNNGDELTVEASNSSKRKQVESYILDNVKKAGSKTTYKVIDNLFKSLSDKDFDALMKRLKSKKEVLSYIVPHSEFKDIKEHTIIKELEKLGVKLEQHLTVDSKKYGKYKTPIKYLILDLPIKRASQTLDKGVSVPTGNSTSMLTGQVANDAASSKLTYPETQLLVGYGLEKSISELFVPRGGDLGASAAMDAYLYKTGSAKLEDVKKYGTGVVSTKTLKSYLSASHLRNTL